MSSQEAQKNQTIKSARWIIYAFFTRNERRRSGKRAYDYQLNQPGIDLFSDYEAYKELASSERLRFIISNTTEAGIVCDEKDRLEDRPQKTFPGKLTAFLYFRYQAFKGDQTKGCVLIPCELIENNGEKLKETVLHYAGLWKLEEGFTQWIHEANTFCNSLVDRIVPGFPVDSIDEITADLGYQDDLIVVGEQYYLWVIEGPDWIGKELPCGCRAPYKDRQRPHPIPD